MSCRMNSQELGRRSISIRSRPSIWSRQHSVGSHWPNPFTGNAIMVVVQTGDEGLDQWHAFERDVAADFRRYHDMQVDKVDAVAVMTDADNSAGKASACYRLPQFRLTRLCRSSNYCLLFAQSAVIEGVMRWKKRVDQWMR